MSYVNFIASDKNIIIYRPELNRITGSPIATILLCQIMYWSSKFQHKEFYKNIYNANRKAKKNNQKSWSEELGLNRYQTGKAFTILKEKQLITLKVENSSHNTYVKLNRDKLEYELSRLYTDTMREIKPVFDGEKWDDDPLSRVNNDPLSRVNNGPLSKVNNGPLPKVNNGTITETTQRLQKDSNRDSDNSLLKRMEEENEKKLTNESIKNSFKVLSNAQKNKVIDELKNYMRINPACKKFPHFKNAVIRTSIDKCMKESSLNK